MPAGIVVTLGEVTFLDSTGPGRHRRLASAADGVEFSLTGASPGIRRI
jgi:hypothetical protein